MDNSKTLRCPNQFTYTINAGAKTCPSCGGNGGTLNPDTMQWTTCPTCNGKGWIS